MKMLEVGKQKLDRLFEWCAQTLQLEKFGGAQPCAGTSHGANVQGWCDYFTTGAHPLCPAQRVNCKLERDKRNWLNI